MSDPRFLFIVSYPARLLFFTRRPCQDPEGSSHCEGASRASQARTSKSSGTGRLATFAAGAIGSFLFNDVSGLAPAFISWGTVSSVLVYGGSAANTFNVQGTGSGIPLTLSTGIGGNVLNLGSSGNTLDGLQGAVNITGWTGGDHLNVNDQGAAGARGYTLTATSLDRSGVASITYGTPAGMVINADSGKDALTVGSRAPTFAVTFHGSGAETVVGPNTNNTWSITGPNAGAVGKNCFHRGGQPRRRRGR